MAMRSIYPEQFFNLPHPAAPVINIQFRTRINSSDDDITKSDYWESITFSPSNFFDSMTLEDSGGAYKIKLNLFDKNFAYIEDVIVRSLVATRLANQLVRDTEYSAETPEIFQFWISKKSSANMRIRFGYSENYNGDDYINATSLKDSDWQNRDGSPGNMKPVIKTPWLYFQMLNTNFNLTPKGLEVEIEAFSTMGNFLSQAKLVETYTRLYGEPEYVLNEIKKRIESAAESSGDKVTFRIQDKPKGYLSQDEGVELVEIMLGAEPVTREDGTVVQRGKTLRSLLNELVGAMRQVKYDEDGNIVPESSDNSPEAEGDLEENKEADQTYPYSYYIVETEDSTEIVFYYQNPQRSLSEQQNVRTYVWLEEGKSIIKNLDIKTNTDFAMLNLPILNISSSSGEITAQVARGRASNSDDQENQVDFSIGSIIDVTAALASEEFESMFVRDINVIDDLEITNERLSPAQLGAMISSRIVSNLNQQIFQGTLELFGDPFFLFDDVIQPFVYLIKIIVNRPNYLDAGGNFVPGGKSYLSGYYAVKKITHDISRSGFDTRLEVMKFNSNGN